ncbi:uncharacterized protein LOC128135329 [Harpia harpyja]|uniref:uncharacterized protein LOC128135329 n=1 Tax=Harpia harpyja TaxID=202280 RepID=UPI0022B0B845|nr:uncharacterized protein LOC128135329 [Harpia harpyja]
MAQQKDFGGTDTSHHNFSSFRIKSLGWANPCTEKGGGSPTPFPPGKRGIAGRGCLREVGSSCALFGEGVGSESGQEKCRARQEGAETIRRLRAEPGGDVVIFVLVVLFCFPGDWDNSWSGLFIPVGNTSLYGLQDAVGGSGTKRASNVKAPSEEEIILLGPRAWTLEGMAQRSDLKAPSLWVETLLCIARLARKAARGHSE